MERRRSSAKVGTREARGGGGEKEMKIMKHNNPAPTPFVLPPRTLRRRYYYYINIKCRLPLPHFTLSRTVGNTDSAEGLLLCAPSPPFPPLGRRTLSVEHEENIDFSSPPPTTQPHALRVPILSRQDNIYKVAKYTD